MNYDKILDLKYLKRAYEVTQRYSRDPRTQNGAILVTAEGMVKDGNHFPLGVHETLERWEKPLKVWFVEHAERNVIYEAAKQGIATNGATMYVPWFACPDCARGIIQAGITRVVGHAAPFHHRPDWQASIDAADTMLREAKISFIRYEHKFNGIKILFDGKEVEP